MNRFYLRLILCAMLTAPTFAQQPESAAPETTDTVETQPERRPFFQRLFGRRERPQKEQEPVPTPGPPRPNVKPEKPAPARESSPKPSAPKPAATPKPTVQPKPSPEPVSTPAPEPTDTPADQGIQMDEAPAFTEPAPAPAQSVLVSSSGDVVEKLRKLRVEAREDQAVQSALQQVQKATTEPEYYEARKTYLTELYKKIRALDPELGSMIDATEAASIRRLESKREMMRSVFEAGGRPEEGSE